MNEPVLISIDEAAKLGVERLRKIVWAHPFDHLKITIYNGLPGPWVHLYSPMNMDLNHRDPVDIICYQMTYSERCWVHYDGPLPDSEEYKEAVAGYIGRFK